MTSYKSSRRSFLQSVGLSSGLAGLLRTAEASAQGAASKRLILSLFPCGTVRNEWLPKGSARDFTFGQILTPFERFKSRTVVVDGLNNVTNGAHEPGLLGIVTGAFNTGAMYTLASRASFDQVLLREVPALGGTMFASLQVAGDTRVEYQVQKVISYSGANTPLDPENDPLKIYRRLFGSYMPGAGGPANEERLRRARARRQSVLDFARRDLDRLGHIMPAAQREKIDIHASVIRELEQSLDKATAAGACGLPAEPQALAVNSDKTHATICGLMSSLVGAALACDLTRVVSVLWAPVVSHVGIGTVVPGNNRQHHDISHGNLSQPASANPIIAMDRFYAERSADILKTLDAIPDGSGAGTMMDSTLMLYFSEIAHGGHSPTNIPIALVGGRGVRLSGGQFLTMGGRPTSDLWMSIGGAFGVDMTKHVAMGSRKFTALPGVFDA